MENKEEFMVVNEQLIKELKDVFGDGQSFSLDDLDLNDFEIGSFNQVRVNSKESTKENLSLLEILKKKVKTQEELELLKKKSCFVNVMYNDGSVLVLHTTLNQEVLAKQYAYQKENALFDLDRYRYFVLDDDSDCTQIKITEENIYKDDELILFINSVL